MEWLALPFDELTVRNLHDLYALRCEVFVVEQNCPYQEIDNKDLKAVHIMCVNNERILACARIVPPHGSYRHPSIGRVAVRQSERAKGLGRQLMDYTIEWTHKLFPQQDIVISAQSYLEKFYHSLEFETVGDEYMEDNIPHLRMIKKFNPIPN